MNKAAFVVPYHPRDAKLLPLALESISECSRELDYRILVIVDSDDVAWAPLGGELLSNKRITVILRRSSSQGNFLSVGFGQLYAAMVAVDLHFGKDDGIIVKMDADALILRPGWLERAARIISADDRIGGLGAFVLGANNKPKLGNPQVLMSRYRFGFWHPKHVKTNLSALGVFLARPKLTTRGTMWFRKILDEALRHGYPLGAFPSGGAYMLRAKTMKEIKRLGLLHSDVLGIGDIGEELLAAILVYAAGYRFHDDVDTDGLFGITWKNLPMSPRKCWEKGWFFVHSIKYGYEDMSSEEVVEEFRKLREGSEAA